MTQGARHAAPCREIPPGSLSGLGWESFYGIQHILHVWSQSGWAGVATGTMARPFTTIGAAVTAAAALTPAEANRILILVWPGIYDEQVTLADDYVYLAGVDRDACVVAHATTPIRVTANRTAVWTMTFRTTAGNVNVGYMANGKVDFILFEECAFFPSGLDNNSYFLVVTGKVIFKDCKLHAASGNNRIYLGQQNVGNYVAFIGCDVIGYNDVLDGDTYVQDCNFWSAAVWNLHFRLTYDNVTILGSKFVSTGWQCITFDTQPGGDVVIVGNTFEVESSGGRHCLDAGVAITGLVIEDNVMFATGTSGGIHQNISHVKPERIVGASGMCDWYATTQEALTSCTFDDIVVRLKRDEALAASISPPARPVIIDGCGKHTLTRAGGAVAILTAAGGTLELRDLGVAGQIQVAGVGGTALVVRDVELSGMILISGSTNYPTIDVIDSTILGDGVTRRCIYINVGSAIVRLKRSRLKAGANFAAIYWNQLNDELRVQDCAIMHGNLGANNPFNRSGAQTPNYRSTHSIYNLDPQTGAIWTNLVAAAQRFDSYDVNGDY